MKTTSNISTINALVRITCGLAMLSYLTAKMVRKPWKQSYYWVAIMAAMKVGEGVLRYCPMTALFGKGQHMYKSMLEDIGDLTFDKNASSKEANSTTDSSINPS